MRGARHEFPADRLLDTIDACIGISLDLMFPDAKDGPTLRFEAGAMFLDG